MSDYSNGLIQRDAAVLWHPFTQHGIEKTAIPIARAQDASLFTTDNFEIIDCISSWWTITHGHNNATINRALREQSDTLSHVMFAGFTHEPAINLAEKLLSLTHHHFAKVFYADNGSSAVEVALKLAYQFHYNNGDPEKKIFLSFDGGYHGDTFGAMATGQTTGFYDPFKPFLCETLSVPYAPLQKTLEATIELETKALAVLEVILETHHNKIACMIMEPLMQGASGMRVCRPDFINKICNRLKQDNILLIFDEIATGFGRTGTMFAHEQCTVKPDLMCVSKGLTGGYMPLSATLVTQTIFDAFLDTHYKKSFTHGHSFTANPLACAVACANIDLFTTDKTLLKVAKIKRTYMSIASDMQRYRNITNVRILGSLLAWDIDDKNADYKTKNAESIKDALLKAGYNMRPLGKTFYLLPPYCIRMLGVHLHKIFDFFK
ncbi:MAG: adenosylmethionine-8-amino-7-oxononanoate aminotransferase [Alphaproteobacteria bacterium]|jgi:adenosylmethionine-8-amino-7-oxononanoate aminotransferase